LLHPARLSSPIAGGPAGRYSAQVNRKRTRMAMTAEGNDDDARRIARLEEHVAHQAIAIEDLSDQLAEQWRVIEQLRAKLDRLTERFLVLEEGAAEAPAITRPPHY
jgi:SlyX protein